MPAIIHLSDPWEHTLNEIVNHDAESEGGIIMRAWVKHNKLEHITSLLIYDLNDFLHQQVLFAITKRKKILK